MFLLNKTKYSSLCPRPRLLGSHGILSRGVIRVLLSTWKKGNLSMAKKWTIFENRSTTVRMVVFPSEGGRPVTKSTEMWDHGRVGVGKGLSSPVVVLLDPLQWAQVGHAATYTPTSWVMEGHQNCCWTRLPGLQDKGEAWPQRMTPDHRLAGTSRQSGGHPSGM